MIISAPASLTAASIRLREYFPEPKIKRELNSFPPKTNLSSFIVYPFYSLNSSARILKTVIAWWAAQSITLGAKSVPSFETSLSPSPHI